MPTVCTEMKRLPTATDFDGWVAQRAVEPYTLQWFLDIESHRHGRRGRWIPRLLEFAKHSGDTLLGLGNGLGTDWLQYARHGAAVSSQSRRLGVITSGTHSFFLGYPIALASVEARSLQVGDRAVVEVRGREAPAEVVKLPFYRGSARSLSENKEGRHG